MFAKNIKVSDGTTTTIQTTSSSTDLKTPSSGTLSITSQGSYNCLSADSSDIIQYGDSTTVALVGKALRLFYYVPTANTFSAVSSVSIPISLSVNQSTRIQFFCNASDNNYNLSLKYNSGSAFSNRLTGYLSYTSGAWSITKDTDIIGGALNAQQQNFQIEVTRNSSYYTVFVTGGLFFNSDACPCYTTWGGFTTASVTALLLTPSSFNITGYYIYRDITGNP